MNRQEAGKLYDEFPPDKQDIPRERFIQRVMALTDPTKMQDDLDKLVASRRNKKMIDDAVRRRSQ